MLDPQREIQALVDTFVTDLSQLAKRIAIEQIKAAFEFGAPSLPTHGSTGASASAGAQAPARGRRGRRAGGESRDVEGLRDKLVAVITDNPGRRTEDLNAALGTATPQLAPLLRKLVAEHHVRTEGARRGTRYFATGTSAAGDASARRAQDPEPTSSEQTA